MSWEDMFLKYNVDPENIIKALAQVFGVQEDMIVLEYGWGWHDGLSNTRVQILCRLDIIRGDFPIRLQIALWREDLIPDDSERYAILGRLCDLLNSPAIVSSEVENPYIWTLIHGEGDYQYVYIRHSQEFEINNELYKFTRQLSLLEAEMAILITGNAFDTEWGGRDSFMWLVSSNNREDLLPILSNIRLEAQRMGREEFLQDAIELLEKSSHSS